MHFTASADDLESIKMLTAKGLTKCPHLKSSTGRRDALYQHFRRSHPGHDPPSLMPPALKRKQSMVDDDDEDDEDMGSSDRDQENEDDAYQEQSDVGQVEDDEDVPINLTSATNQVPKSNDKFKCLHSNCDKSFTRRFAMLDHNRTDHQCTDQQSCPGMHIFPNKLYIIAQSLPTPTPMPVDVRIMSKLSGPSKVQFQGRP
ncbi:hypothetical protein SAMD00019534_054300 [Acytostelium subglobosum LB1]|uniref:hypothetical protein n=1 Tax=Acytostelium subglobosum LB1 TaxID=1410327 RepID=UPI000644F931|nr:hypothetical protein SAMD00019534_054300 [Acytostelium subglobosum LB1]GAM22255.1 hypothetical protein SAMD00019534_054300 [Acytostelium subglobosum LB1]|eukprot:XP_012754375.1 hypothetical protein SAMD00019534_054300 [Acytostelium subglobosum LB1]